MNEKISGVQDFTAFIYGIKQCTSKNDGKPDIPNQLYLVKIVKYQIQAH